MQNNYIFAIYLICINKVFISFPVISCQPVIARRVNTGVNTHNQPECTMNIKQLMTVSFMGLLATGSYALPVMADEVENPSGGQTMERVEGRHMEWRERRENMSPEGREKHKAEHEALREKMKNMTPEEKQSFWKQRREEKLANMTPEERKAFEERRAEMRKKFENMTPEEKRAFRKQRREEKLANMTPEERKAFEERRAEMRKKFESMTPEERDAFRKKRHMKWKEDREEGV